VHAVTGGWRARGQVPEVLRVGGVPLDDHDLKVLIESYDANGDGSIDYNEVRRSWMSPTEE